MTNANALILLSLLGAQPTWRDLLLASPRVENDALARFIDATKGR